jgi:ribosomal protein S12 methylthiotransferase accessory factor YcaO
MDFPYTGLDRLGVPAYSTALWPEDGAFCNGLGAGPSLEHALSHGLLELIQRDGNSVNYRALDQGMAVDIETSDPETRNLLTHLDREGVEVIVKLAATDFGMANLYVVGYDRDPGDAPHPLALSAYARPPIPTARSPSGSRS